jgi:hypothetical protein
MPLTVAELRRSAQHCRDLSDISRDGPARVELARMAAEFDEEADKLERKSARPRLKP